MKKAALILVVLLLGGVMSFQLRGQVIKNNGAYLRSSANAYTVFGGSGNLDIITTGGGETSLGNLKVDFTGDGTYKATIPAGSALEVTGNLYLNDSLVIEASPSGHSRLKLGGTVTGSRARVGQYLSSEQWHFVSSPVENATIATYMNIYLMEWDEPSGQWNYLYYPVTLPLETGRGYSAWAANALTGSKTVWFRGLLNDSDVSKNLSYTVPGTYSGFHLVGNPFACDIAWNSSWGLTNVDPTMYMFDGAQYKSWNFNLPPELNTLSSNIIPATQGFFVHANNSGASITIPKSELVISTVPFYKNTLFVSDVTCKLKVKDPNGNEDQVVVFQMDGATEGFDNEWDAWKLSGSSDVPELWLANGEDKLMVNALPEIMKGTEVQLGLVSPAEGWHHFELINYQTEGANLPLYLLDQQENELIRIDIGRRYDFWATPENNTDRFRLVFGDPYTETPGMADAMYVSVDDNSELHVFLENSGPSEIWVTDIMGRLILHGKVEGNIRVSIPDNYRNQWIIVRAYSNGVISTQKVFMP
ncbi:MAG: hypothetical protein Kow00127_01430 [Bacteroidales bacterium]